MNSECSKKNNVGYMARDNVFCFSKLKYWHAIWKRFATSVLHED